MRAGSMVARFGVIAAQTQYRLQTAGVDQEDAERIRFSVINLSHELKLDVTEIAAMLADDSTEFETADARHNDLDDAIRSARSNGDHRIRVHSAEHDADGITLDLSADVDHTAKRQNR